MQDQKVRKELHKKFIHKIEQRYGKFNPVKFKFEATSNSKIARDLFYSDSQFSRLIHNTASLGELKRALGNIERLLQLDLLTKQTSRNETQGSRNYLSVRNVVVAVLFLMILLVLVNYVSKYNFLTVDHDQFDETRYEMLNWGFENDFIKPYVKLKELPNDCYYPCYKYQGKWELKNEYKIPFFRERNGFHYLAKDAIMYSRCMDERDDRGISFEGYEYQKHEIWYDKREFPIDSFLNENSNTLIKENYNLSNFELDPNFVKIAYVHTFFRTEFKIDSTLIHRSGKAIGRDIEFVSDKVLSNKLSGILSVNEAKNEIRAIATNRLEDFSKPISCSPTDAPDLDFNLVEEGDEMGFNCQFSIGQFLVGYNKTYILKDQYINNYCR